MTVKSKSSIDQSDKFKQAARELGCDEDEARFDERLKQVAGHRPDDPDASAVNRSRKSAKKKPGG